MSQGCDKRAKRAERLEVESGVEPIRQAQGWLERVELFAGWLCGAEAEVLEPTSLRRELQETAARLLTLYGKMKYGEDKIQG
jgi:hypothetical protein